MRQDRIMELLLLAAKPNAKHYQHQEIISELVSSITAKRNKLSDKDHRVCVGCLQKAVSEIFWGYISYYPEKLPEIFPFFSLICGDNVGADVFSKIDWGLYQKILTATVKS